MNSIFQENKKNQKGNMDLNEKKTCIQGKIDLKGWNPQDRGWCLGVLMQNHHRKCGDLHKEGEMNSLLHSKKKVLGEN